MLPPDSHAAVAPAPPHPLRTSLDIDAGFPTRLALPVLPSGATIADCDRLLIAVATTLRDMADAPMPGAGPAPVAGDGELRRSRLMECALALEQAHVRLERHHRVRQQLEQALMDSRVTMAQTRDELAGTRASQDRARYLALHDGLTSLPNRAFFIQQLRAAMAEAMQQQQLLAVLFLDLDGFKPINDTHGHAAGDELLRIVAARLTRTVRARDMVCRLGGDEFACLLAGVPSREQLEHLVHKLRDAVQAPCRIGDITLTVRASVGIAVAPKDGDTADALLAKADTAMYHAKRHHGGQSFFDQLGDH